MGAGASNQQALVAKVSCFIICREAGLQQIQPYSYHSSSLGRGIEGFEVTPGNREDTL
jgi:hypothetical protein